MHIDPHCSCGFPWQFAGSHSSPVVVFLDYGHLCFWNYNSTIHVDVVRVKSYKVNGLFDLVSVPMRATINKLYLIPVRVVSGVVDTP